MRYVLENEHLRVEIDSYGAELKSVKDKQTGHEYMWQADPKYWGRTSPILFPFVGSLKNKSFSYDGKTYPMGQHGFARDFEHSLVEHTTDSIRFKFTDNEETLQKYPFSFALCIGYELKGNEVKVLWEVQNTSTQKTMHFSIGAHPAFNCPIHGEASKTGYAFYFEGIDELHHHGNSLATGLSLKESLILPLENHRAAISEDFFDRCTYIAEGNQTKFIGLEDPEGNRILSVLFDMPLFGIWSPEGKNAPFLCIEPWCGRCDAEDFEGALDERAFNNTLNPEEIFTNSYIIRFGT